MIINLKKNIQNRIYFKYEEEYKRAIISWVFCGMYARKDHWLSITFHDEFFIDLDRPEAVAYSLEKYEEDIIFIMWSRYWEFRLCANKKFKEKICSQTIKRIIEKQKLKLNFIFTVKV